MVWMDSGSQHLRSNGEFVNRQTRAHAAGLYLAAVLALLSACSTLPRNPVPPEKVASAQPVAMPGVRAWGGGKSMSFQQDLVELMRQEAPGMFPQNNAGVVHYDALALSDGGSKGTFGAGVLNIVEVIADRQAWLCHRHDLAELLWRRVFDDRQRQREIRTVALLVEQYLR